MLNIKNLSVCLEKVNSENEDGIISSAVLMIISKRDGNYGINFIKRAVFSNDSFSGQVAFPGGKRKKTDISVIDTAVRETIEEVGVDIRCHGEIIGELDIVKPFTPSMSHHVVKPFVSVLKSEVDFIKNYEVEEVFWVPLEHLLRAENRTTRIKIRNGREVNDYVYKFEKYIIWGLTGRILNQFFEKTEGIFNVNF